MSSIFGAFSGAAAANLEQGQRDAAAASRNAGFESTMASLQNTQAVYEGITVIKQVAQNVDQQFEETRDWINGVQKNVNNARDEVRAGRNAAIKSEENTKTLMDMARASQSNDAKIAEAFNAMADVVGELKEEVAALRSELASLRGSVTAG